MEIVKFGGSSLATSANFKLCRDIVQASPKAKVIVVSAPGKFGTYQTKITDDLIKVTRGHKILDAVIKRFYDIAVALLPQSKLRQFKIELYRTKNAILNHSDDANFIISRGEYLTAFLFALYLGYRFVDAYEVLVINHDATIDLPATLRHIQQLKLKRRIPFVIGGFYGQREGHVALFTRGGSDYTGAILAALMNAKIYKNYTDTNGIQTADPHLVYDTQTIPCLDFDALDILTHNGAGIIHENVAKLLKAYAIPLRVDNTFNPNQNFTEVHSPRCRHCQKNFFSITEQQNQITVVSKKNGNPAQVTVINTRPDTKVADIQKLHAELIKTL